MRPNPLATLAAVVTIVVVAFGASACKSSSHASTPSPAQNPPATETQADSASPESTSAPASAPPSVSASASASPASSSAASPSPSAPAAAPAAGKADKAHPCSLVTVGEAEAALGVAATITNMNVDDGLYTVCEYESADSRHILEVSTFDDSQSKSAFDSNVNEMTPESGIGGGALWSSGMGLLSVWQNNVLVDFHLDDESGTMSGTEILAALETVAKAAVARL
jgi:hypothetical protein